MPGFWSLSTFYYTFYVPSSSSFTLTPTYIGGAESTPYNCPDGDNIVNSTLMQISTHFSTFIPVSNSYFGYSRPSIKVKFDFPATGSGYLPNTDEIKIAGSDTTGASHVFGDYGAFVAAHEWTHALHEKGLGGNVPRWLPCPPGHRTNGAYSLQCAYSEGLQTSPLP